ncbi:MAG: type IV pilus secretin PilQ [Gammaproteobacteria bacterium]|nr:type IV pilus secretin PilQ [Gammaproteobacteria bacterium]MBU1414402.1 type IV pilus secretin PilQ [Gammaproteobacteria bacterium]
MKPRHLGLLAQFLAALLLSSGAHAQQADADSAAANSIESLVVAQQSGSTIVKLDLKQAPAKAPSSFSIASPARVVFDFSGTVNGLGRSVQKVNEGDLRSINIVQVGDRTRLVLNLTKAGTYQTQQEGTSFLITLTPTMVGDNATPAVQRFAATSDTKPAEVRSIRDLRFRRGKAGEGLVTLDLSDPNTGIDVRQQGPNLVVEFQNTQVADELRRKMDVTDFATPVTSVATTRQGDNVRVVIAAQGLWEHTAYQSDNQFVVEVKPLKEDPSKLFQGSQRQGYQGEKVSLNFQNIPLRELLHVFADITNFNIVISDSVTGNVSLRLNEVPWDQALEIVLKQKGLAMRKNGNVIWIAPGDELAAREKIDMDARQAMADYEPLRTESFQLNYQKADVLTNALLGGMPKGFTMPQGAKPQRMLTERGSVLFDSRTNKLFITDTPSKLAEVRALITEIDVPVRQVLIEARIVEADNTFSKALGARIGIGDNKGLINGHSLGTNSARWGVAGSQEYVNYHVAPGNPSNFATLQDTPLMTWWNNGSLKYDNASTSSGTNGTTSLSGNVSGRSNAVDLGISGAAGQFALALFNANKTQLLSLELSALEADGKGKTISSPRVLTADQVEATIEDGQEVPYWSASSSGATTVAYRKAVLSLKVRPQITPDGRVLMQLQVNKDNVNSTLSTSYGLAIDTKNVKTDVLVDNGGTVVIGGVFIQEERKTVTKVPFLGDIPVLGHLFKKNEKVDNRRELLIFITPKILNDALSLR